MICEKYPELKYRYRNDGSWCRGYQADTAGKHVWKMQGYIQRQIDGEKTGKERTMDAF